jgi:hypothetical protein
MRLEGISGIASQYLVQSVEVGHLLKEHKRLLQEGYIFDGMDGYYKPHTFEESTKESKK